MYQLKDKKNHSKLVFLLLNNDCILGEFYAEALQQHTLKIPNKTSNNLQSCPKIKLYKSM